MNTKELTQALLDNEKATKHNFWLSIAGIIIAVISLMPQIASLFEIHKTNLIAEENNEIAQVGNTIASTGNILGEQSNQIQEKTFSVAEKTLDIESGKYLREVAKGLETNSIYMCSSHYQSYDKTIQADCNSNNNRPNVTQIQEWLAGLVTVGRYVSKGFSSKDILQFFPGEMIISLCNSQEIRDSATHNREQADMFYAACWIEGFVWTDNNSEK